MALAAALEWDVQTGGSDSNGGFFKRGASGTDYSQQTAPQIAIDGTTVTATVHTTTTQITITGATVTTGLVGNGLKITGGGATAGRYEITAVDTVNNRITVDRSAGASTNTVTGNIGGCLATPGETSSYLVTGNIVHLKSGTYTLTTATAGPAGPWKPSSNIACALVGYETTHEDGGARPVISAGSLTSVNIIDCTVATYFNGGGGKVSNVKVDGTDRTRTGVVGIQGAVSYYTNVFGCEVINCGIGVNNCMVQNSSITVCGNGSGTGVNTFSNCRVDDCTSYGMQGVSGANDTIFTNCTVGYNAATGAKTLFRNCTFDSCTSAFGLTSFVSVSVYGCVITNGTNVFNVASSVLMTTVIGQFYYYNVTNVVNGATEYTLLDYTLLTGDPYTDAGADDYSPNNTSGAGAVLRGVCGPFGQSMNRDAGAVQHTDSGGGGSGAFAPFSPSVVRARFG